MANYPPPYPPPSVPPYGVDPKMQKALLRDQARMQRDMIRGQRDIYRAQVRGLRRSSIVGPLLVITVGVMFLLVQLGRVQGTRLWMWYGRWWPYLLIAVGVIRLAEWGFDQITQRNIPATSPRPRHVLGGGVISLLLLLIGAGVMFSAARNHDDFFEHGFSINPDNIDEFLGDKHESDQTLTQACAPDADVSIENPRGDVSITGTSNDGQIHVTVHKELYTRSDAEATTRAQQLWPKVDASAHRVSVVMPTVEGGKADLAITVPATVALTINANRGDVRVSALNSPVSVTANHGDVELTAIRGPVSGHINNGDSSLSAHSVTGPIAIEGRGKDLTLSDLSGPVSLSGEFFGTTHLEHVRGPIRFHTSRTDLQLARLDGEVEISPNADLSADQAAGPVTLNTRNRNITLERVSGDLSVTNRNGSVDLTLAPPLGNISVENRNGSVNLTLPSGAGFVVQADTANGDLENEFSLPNGGGENHPSISGTVNKGGPLVRVSTSQGDVSLKKGSVAPLSLAPPAPPEPPAAPAGPLSTMPESARESIRHASEQAREAARQASEQVRQAQEQVRHANRDAAEAQREGQRAAAEAQREAQRALAQAQNEAEKAKRKATDTDEKEPQ